MTGESPRRGLSQPVRRLGLTVRRLINGEYEARTEDISGDEVGTLALHVNQLAESLEKSRTARQRWMADIAHELRTPIAVLKGVSGILEGMRRHVDDPRVQQNGCGALAHLF